jgi:hypothetical protein
MHRIACVTHFQVRVPLMLTPRFNVNLTVVRFVVGKPEISNCYNRFLTAERARQPVPDYPFEPGFTYAPKLVHSGIRQFPAATAAVMRDNCVMLPQLYMDREWCQEEMAKIFLRC